MTLLTIHASRVVMSRLHRSTHAYSQPNDIISCIQAIIFREDPGWNLLPPNYTTYIDNSTYEYSPVRSKKGIFESRIEIDRPESQSKS